MGKRLNLVASKIAALKLSWAIFCASYTLEIKIKIMMRNLYCEPDLTLFVFTMPHCYIQSIICSFHLIRSSNHNETHCRRVHGDFESQLKLVMVISIVSRQLPKIKLWGLPIKYHCSSSSSSFHLPPESFQQRQSSIFHVNDIVVTK